MFKMFFKKDSELDIRKNLKYDIKKKYPAAVIMNLLWFSNSVITMASSIVIIPSQIKELVGDSLKGRYMGVLVACCANPYRLCLVLETFIAPNIHNLSSGGNSNHSCVNDLVKKRCYPYLNFLEYEEENNLKEFISSLKNKIISLPRIFTFLLLNIAACAAQSSVSVAYHGLLADQVSYNKRGFVSGFMGCMALIGNMVGAISGILLNFLSIISIYLILCGINSICLLIVVLLCGDNSTNKDKILVSPTCFTVVNSFWKPLTNFNFRWVFFTRFLMQQGVATVTAFLEYWIDDMVLIPNCWSSEAGLTFILLPMLLTSAIFSILVGYLSDKIKRRKILIVYSCLLMAVCALILAFAPEKNRFYYGLFSSFLFGVGYGSYTAVDFALIMDVTENSCDKATDLAVWHQAMVLPSCIATPIGGMIVDGFQRINCQIGLGYILVYCVSSAYFVLGGLFVLRLKDIN
ncbi:hypothetical protein HZS_686 [Henneguya salminicola]|nr:hypothetical protein HZS_686 [Henneguya salminicola]